MSSRKKNNLPPNELFDDFDGMKEIREKLSEETEPVVDPNKEPWMCIYPGCTSKRDYQGLNRSGVKKFRRVCSKHRYAIVSRKSRVRDSCTRICDKCGWRGRCDRHRLKPGSEGGQYEPDNIAVLCPNCHRAAHGRGSWNQPQFYDEEAEVFRKDMLANYASKANLQQTSLAEFAVRPDQSHNCSGA